jgi:NAD(P)-dependent dehydrogenase (short-subunit alcohol dehydrogenase family)
MSERQDRVVVTGAGGALGRACCIRQLELGHRVLAVDIDVTAGAALADELDAGDQLFVEVADVTDEAAVERYVRVAVELFGGIDGFFNNAGVEGSVTPIVAYPIEAFDRVVAVNLRGVFLGLKHVMAAMAAGGGGSIVNTASVAGLVGVGGISAYVATKHAVVGLTKVAALEGAPSGIRVNAVCPGPVDGRMMQSLEVGATAMLGLPDVETAHAAYVGLVPGGRYGTPAEVAAAVGFLLSAESSYISGAAIPVDWGFTAQ